MQGHRSGELTEVGGRLAIVPKGWGGGLRSAASRALDMEPPCPRAPSLPSSPGAPSAIHAGFA